MIRTVMLTPLMQLCRDGHEPHEVRLLRENEATTQLHNVAKMLEDPTSLWDQAGDLALGPTSLFCFECILKWDFSAKPMLINVQQCA